MIFPMNSISLVSLGSLALTLLCFSVHILESASGKIKYVKSDFQKAQSNDVLDCGSRLLVYEYAKKMQPWRDADTQKQIYDALELPTCYGNDAYVTHDTDEPNPTNFAEDMDEILKTEDPNMIVFVSSSVGMDVETPKRGTELFPFRTLHFALDFLRNLSKNTADGKKRFVILRGGIHFIGNKGPLRLNSSDSHTTIMSYPGERAWISGGLPLSGVVWERLRPGSAIYSTNLRKYPEIFESIKKYGIPGLFTMESHSRIQRARYPNINVETDQWGYGSPNRDIFGLNSNMVTEWHKPEKGKVPTFINIDLSNPSNPTGVVKNNSQMKAYNQFTMGHGGVCSTVWEPEEVSYWCSNSSAGGWAEVDYGCAMEGRLQIPVGMTWNMSSNSLKRFQKWKNPSGAIVHAWHSQSWAMHMFEVENFDIPKGKLFFNRTYGSGRGSQGGRNWCRCDQCSYAAGLWSNNGNWCGRHQYGRDTRLISGSWAIESVFEELDSPNEYFYNRTTGILYWWPNETKRDEIPENITLVVPLVRTLIEVIGSSKSPVKNVIFQNVGFRDAVNTYETTWAVPSGGDWAFFRGAALHVRGAEGLVVKSCSFSRLDGTAILFDGFARNCSVEGSEFFAIGNTAIAGWGNTKQYDGTGFDHPFGTKIIGNIIHNIGLYQKQSSAWFGAKSACTLIENNIIFNLPRAAINFNDGFGGGNIVSKNLIWNTCRESGDHGPINSWDRVPFLTRYSGSLSFDPQPTVITKNFIFANYGAAQAVDNDDGSSFYRIKKNVFYLSDGFKMDYGGHNSDFNSNLVITKPYSGQCIGVGPFLRFLGDSFYGNICFLMSSTERVGEVAQCDPDFISLSNNFYGTKRGNASLGCGNREIPIINLEKEKKIERESKAEFLPSRLEILLLMKSHLNDILGDLSSSASSFALKFK